MTQEKEISTKTPRGRPQRTAIGTRNILTVKGTDPNYVYRFVNDVDDRISQFKEAGYELVPDESVEVGDKRVNNASSVGSAKIVSVGQGTKAYLMRIKKEWFEEDKARKLAHVAEIERATQNTNANGADYGEVKISRN